MQLIAYSVQLLILNEHHLRSLKTWLPIVRRGQFSRKHPKERKILPYSDFSKSSNVIYQVGWGVY